MCHHELWATSVCYPFSSLNNSLGLTGGKYYQQITIPIFRLILQNFAFQVAFLILFSIVLFSPYFLMVGLLLQYVTVSVQGTRSVLHHAVCCPRRALRFNNSLTHLSIQFNIAFICRCQELLSAASALTLQETSLMIQDSQIADD